jgi:hypothetical protein
MGKKSRATFKKRQKEMARQQRQRDKMARRLESRERPAEPREHLEGEDPDIAGIRPGPQPLPSEWQYTPPTRGNAPKPEGEGS